MGKIKIKASNVLLDKDMNPKISDFGLAKMFSENQCEANTNRVVETNFGVLLLEIVSGKKNNGYLSEHIQSLLNFAWKLWREGHGLEHMDPCLSQSCVATEIIKCIHLGLLCVQQDPADRPTMSIVVFVLENDPHMLPQPSQPAFSIGRIVVRSVEPQSNHQLCSVNEVTVSILSPDDHQTNSSTRGWRQILYNLLRICLMFSGKPMGRKHIIKNCKYKRL